MSGKSIASWLLFVGFILAIFWACSHEPESSKNPSEVAKKEGIVDPKSCISCHKEQVESFLKTGKGRSFFPANANKAFEKWDVNPVYDPIKDFYYVPYRRGESFFVKEFRLENQDTIHSRTEKIDFFIGSGNQTRSYLYQRNGYLFEIPITWYSKKKIWDLSPGYEKGANQRFEREVGEECMFCHNSGFDAIPNSLNRYADFGNAIGCESCHGPVKKHLDEMKKSGGKSKNHHLISIGKLPLQAQLDVCRQCHLEGVKVRKEKAKPDDYAPGKLFSDYFEIFVPATGEKDFGFASHAERLQLSKCFTASNGKMNCTTCHDPHNSIPNENKVEFFSQKCRSCHQENDHQKACSEIKRVGGNLAVENCLKCHMQVSGTNDIPHVSSSDHWIRRDLSKAKDKSGREISFKNFAGSSFTKRDKAMAFLQYAESRGDTVKLKELGRFINDLDPEIQLKFYYLNKSAWQNKLDTSRFSESSNPWTWFYWAQLKREKGFPFMEGLEKACGLAPSMVEFQYRMAVSKSETIDKDLAYEKVLDLNPFHVKSLSNLGFYALQNGDFAKAKSLLVKALGQDPDYVLANENLARCYMEQGKFAQSKKILNRLISRFPAEVRYNQILSSIP